MRQESRRSWKTAPWYGVAVVVMCSAREDAGGRWTGGGAAAPPPVTECSVALLDTLRERHLQAAQLEGSGGGGPRRLLHVGQRGRLGLLSEPVRVGLLLAALHAGTLVGVLGRNTDVDVV